MTKRIGGLVAAGLVATAGLTAGPAIAMIVRVPALPELAEPEEKPKLAAPEFRANQVNRCVDSRGRVVLQDAPCFAPPVASAVEVSEVRELSELVPRPVNDASPKPPSESPPGFFGWVRAAWWKLAVLLACGWAAYRLWQLLRANWFFRQYAGDSPEKTR